MNIFITKNGQQLGPYNLDQIHNQVNAGTLDAADWAWYEGLTDWIPLNQVPGFGDSQSPAYSAAPPPPSSPRKRPILVWIISIFYFITLPLSLISLALIPLELSGAIPITDAQRQYFESLTIVDHSLTGLTILLNLTGAILLFLLRLQALYCFGSVFILNVLNWTYQIIFKNWLAVVGTGVAGMIGATIGIVFGLAINIAILIYVWYLYATKVLR